MAHDAAAVAEVLVGSAVANDFGGASFGSFVVATDRLCWCCCCGALLLTVSVAHRVILVAELLGGFILDTAFCWSGTGSVITAHGGSCGCDSTFGGCCGTLLPMMRLPLSVHVVVEVQDGWVCCNGGGGSTLPTTPTIAFVSSGGGDVELPFGCGTMVMIDDAIIEFRVSSCRL